MFILHYTSTKLSTAEEYVILLDQDTKPAKKEINERRRPGFEAQKPIELECYESTSMLPFDEELHKQ